MANHWTGRKHRPETLAKIAAASRRLWQDPDFRELQIARAQAYRHSPESRAKISASNKGRISPQKGLPRSAEIRQRISEGHRGKPKPWLRGRKRDPRAVEKTAAALRGRPSKLRGIPKPDGFGEKISLALKGNRNGRGTRTAETRAKISLAMQGNKRGLGRRDTPEVKTRRAESLARYFSDWPRPKTCLEHALASLLKAAGFYFVEQKQIGRRVVDAFIPTHNLVFEADGHYWHRDVRSEAARDQYLLSKGITAIIHLTDKDLTPWLP